MTELDRSRDEVVHVHPIFLPDGRRFLFLGCSNDRSKSAIYLASLDSQTRTRLIDVYSQPDYAPGFLLYQRGGAVMAHPFDEKQGRLTGDAVAIAEGVDTDTINARASFAASANGALIYRSGSATGGAGRLTWFDRSGKTLGTVAENGDMWALPMTGGRKPFPLIATAFNENSAAFSPSGRFIAYASNDSGVSQVYVQPFSADRGTGAAFDGERGGAEVDSRWPHRSVFELRGSILGEDLRGRDRVHGR